MRLTAGVDHRLRGIGPHARSACLEHGVDAVVARLSLPERGRSAHDFSRARRELVRRRQAMRVYRDAHTRHLLTRWILHGGIQRYVAAVVWLELAEGLPFDGATLQEELAHAPLELGAERRRAGTVPGE